MPYNLICYHLFMTRPCYLLHLIQFPTITSTDNQFNPIQ